MDFETKEFERWSKKLTPFVYDSTCPYFNILVPTEDTVKFKEILKMLMKGGFNTLINGETGTGKSVIIQKYLNELS